MTDPADLGKRWMFGPIRDLMFGCGLCYCAAFLALAFAGDSVRRLLPFAFTPFLILVTGIPHYGATLLRVYARPEDRRKYSLFSVYATLVVIAAFAVGTRNLLTGSWLVTIYLAWSPWHYSGQNYGIAMMFLRRRGVEITPLARRCLHLSFVLSFLLTAVMLLGVSPDVSYAPAPYERGAYHLIRIPLPGSLTNAAIIALAAAYLGSVVVAGSALLRRASLPELGPTAVLVGSQALWFAVPALARHLGVLQGVEPLGVEHATYAFLWIAVAHSVQYLWVTYYFARRSDPAPSVLGYSGRTLFAGAAVWVVPALLFAPGALGRVPFDGGLGLLVASAVNIHHFILDGAIWKLRDGRIARILLRGQRDGEATVRPRRAWLPALGWTIGMVSVGVWTVSTLEQAVGLEQALRRGDVERVELAQQRLARIGQESARAHMSLAMLYQQRGDGPAADRHAAAALALFPGEDCLFDLSTYHHRARQGDRAIEFARLAQRSNPDSPKLAHRLAWLLLVYDSSDPESVVTATELARQAVAATGEHSAAYLSTLAMAHAAAGRFERALETADRAARIAGEQHDQRLLELVLRNIDSYRDALRRRGR